MFVDNVHLNSVAEIDEQISNAKADEIRHEQYQADVVRQKEKAGKSLELKNNKAIQRTVKGDRIKLLSGKAENTGIPEFSFDADGGARFQDTSMDMLSTSQLMTLSSMLSGMYPKGLGIELIDRAESLGDSIYGYIGKAEAESRTILATIVGNEPAEVPENIGVFVVEGGKIK